MKSENFSKDTTSPLISRHTGLRLSLLLIVVVVLLAVVSCRVHSGERSPSDSIQSAQEIDEEMKALAGEVAVKWLGADSEKVADFIQELVEAYAQVKDRHFAIIYNTGGFGGTSIDDDPEWSEVVHGIQRELAMLGYDAAVLDYTRSTLSLTGFIGELRDLIRNYAGKAPLLAGKVDFLTRAVEDLKVIITGRCFGAIFSNEAMELIEDNHRVYSIQAGHPFWYRPMPAANTLLMEDNGLMPDSICQGDLWAILRANLTHGPSLSRPPGGSIMIGPIFIRAPGHEYTWEHPSIRENVTTFLKERFGLNADEI